MMKDVLTITILIAIMNQTNNDLSKSKNHDNSDPDISDAFTDDARKLPDLYARRNQLLQMLNLTLSDLLEEIEEEYYRGIRTKPY